MRRILMVLTVALLMAAMMVGTALPAVAFDPCEEDPLSCPPLPPPLPTSTEQCKNGGWQNFQGRFKNEGDCMSFVTTGGKNQPANPPIIIGPE